MIEQQLTSLEARVDIFTRNGVSASVEYPQGDAALQVPKHPVGIALRRLGRPGQTIILASHLSRISDEALEEYAQGLAKGEKDAWEKLME